MIRYVVGVSGLAMVAAPALAQSAGQGGGASENESEQRKVEEIVVTGVREDSFPNGVSREAVVGVFGQRPLLDTPISAKSFNDLFIANQQAFTSNELASRDASFVPSNSGVLTGSDGGNIRGFRSQAYESSFDGFSNVMNRRVPLEFVERVDILKGPATFHSGVRFFGGAGGTINYISKKPLDAPLTRISLLYGNSAQFGGAADISRRFGAEDAFGVRANIAFRDGEVSVDGLNEQNRVAHLAFDARLGDVKINLQYGATLGRVNGAIDGIGYDPGVSPGRVPDAGRFRGPEWSFSEYDYQFVRANFEWKPAEYLTFFGAAGMSAYTEEFLNLQLVQTNAAGDFVATYYPQFGRADWGDFWNADIGARFTATTGPLRHTITLAYSHQRYLESFRGVAFPIEEVRGNIFDGSLQTIPAPVLADDRTYYPLFDNIGRGFVVSNEIAAFDDRVLLTVGVRRSNIRQEFFAFAEPTPNGQPVRIYDEGRWLPSLGLVVKPAANITLYANWLKALERGATAPGNAVNAGASTPPLTSTQYEAGVKAEFQGFGVTAAVFEIERPSAFLDPVTREFGLFGRQRHRGFELDVFGEILKGVRAFGSYAYLDARIVRSAGGTLDGRRPISVPDHSISAGIDADIAVIPGLAVLANGRHVGRQFFDATNARSIPAFTVFDAGARYSFDLGDNRATVRLNILNLFDKNYFQSANFTTPPGAPRTVRLGLAVDF